VGSQRALFYIREILLYVYLYGMPIAIALGYGNIPIVSDICDGVLQAVCPLAVLPYQPRWSSKDMT